MPETNTVTVPDLQAAQFAWSVVYDKRPSDGVFRNWCQKLRIEITTLWQKAEIEAGVDAVTFTVIDQMPAPAREFYSILIDATECLDELIADHDPMYVEGRHAPLVLIGDALGVLQVDRMRTRVEACCRVCRHQVADRLHAEGGADTSAPQ
ncbi:hypothetical protein ACWF9B_08485 [Streptomyces sp. NPDC055089]